MTDYRGRGLPVYAVGTISGASGSSIVTGDGTAWIGADESGLVFNRVGAGDTLIIPGVDAEITIKSVQSATQIELERPLPAAIPAESAYRIIVRAPNPAGYVNRALAMMEERLSRLFADDGGRLVLRTVSGAPRLSWLAYGSSTPVDLQSFSGSVVFDTQGAPATQNAAGALTAAQLATRLVTMAPAGAITITSPTGAALDAGFPNIGNDFAFDVAFVNTGAGAVTLNGAAGVTRVGSGSIPAGKSNLYRLRRTGAAAWTAYCISSA